MSLPRYVMYCPNTEECSESPFFTLPSDVFDHKEYPTCLSCHQKYVPVDKGDIWCFKCKMMNVAVQPKQKHVFEEKESSYRSKEWSEKQSQRLNKSVILEKDNVKTYFQSIKEARIATGASSFTANLALKGKIRTLKGYTWRYENT